MKIEKYEAKVENGQIVHYAITKKGDRIRMPDAFSDMYTEDYLEISETTSPLPEVLGLPEGKYFIPRRTAPVTRRKPKVSP